MKDIMSFCAPKYKKGGYTKVDVQIYQKSNLFVTSLCFQQEPEYGEGDKANLISQYPLEDLLDRFFVFVSDFYTELNTSKSKTCYLEFASSDLSDIQKLCGIIGKHVYAKKHLQNGNECFELVIE